MSDPPGPRTRPAGSRLLLAGALLLPLSLAGNVLVLRQYLAYRDRQPPESAFMPDVCGATTGLVAHWKLDEVHGGLTPDATGRHPGKLHAKGGAIGRLLHGLPALVPGVPGAGEEGRALELHARQWVSGGNDDCYVSDQLTLAAWVWQETDDPAKTEVPTILAKSKWPTDGWWLATTTRGLQKADRFVDVGIAWGSGYTHVESGYQLPLRAWHHVAVSLDNARHEARFYVDGQPFGALHKGVHAWRANYDHDLLVGEYDGSCRWPWYGKLDDVRVYNRVLTDDEIAAVHAALTPR